MSEKLSAARRAAFDVLLRVATREAYAVELLHSELLDGLSAADRGLATEIVMGVLRWQSLLDREIAAASGRAVAKLDIEVLIALRIAAYQLRFLERVPGRAAVNESVELVKRARKRSAVPFANAVLRKLASAPSASLPGGDSAAELAARYAHPEWLVMRWSTEFGADAARRICEFDQHRPVTTLRLTGDCSEEELIAEGLELAPGELLREARRVVAGDPTRTRAYAERRLVIQDEASQLVALLVGRGTRILDCCAAPGGKTRAVAQRNPQADVVAAELHPHRARLMRSLVAEKNVNVVTADARELPLSGGFDRVLADLPCSGTGTLARNPEIKWKLTQADITDLAQRQAAILDAALVQLAPGGQVVYSTCSLEAEEGEQIVRSALQQRPEFAIVPMRPRLEELCASGELVWRDVDSLVRGEFLRTLPGVHPCDGFFAALLERVR